MNHVVTGRTYRQTVRAEKQERTRQALLDAAEDAFFSGRWEQISLTEMAAGARVTKQTLLRHFSSKEGLLEQAMARGRRRVRDQRWRAPAHDLPGAVDNLLDHYEEVGERALKIAAASGGGDAMVETGHIARQLHYDWVEHAFGAWLKQRRGRARTRDRAALIALCDVHTWWLLSHDLGLPRYEVRATLIRAIKGLLKGEV